MKHYLLPCSCSRRIAVSAAQAGGTVRCPDCAAEIVVPRLGTLSGFDVARAEPVAGPEGGWSNARACLFAGVVAALAGAATAAWIHGQRSAGATLNESATRAAVAAAPIGLVHASWLRFEREGIARPPVADEERRIRRDRALRTLETIAWAVATAGTVAGGVGAALATAQARARAVAGRV